MAVGGIEYAAMGYGQDAVAGMLAYHLFEESNDAMRKFAEALATLQWQVGLA